MQNRTVNFDSYLMQVWDIPTTKFTTWLFNMKKITCKEDTDCDNLEHKFKQLG